MRRIRRCGLGGESVSLWVGFGFQRPKPGPATLPAAPDPDTELSAVSPAPRLPASMTMN